jgi:hypothetical protein
VAQVCASAVEGKSRSTCRALGCEDSVGDCADIDGEELHAARTKPDAMSNQSIRFPACMEGSFSTVHPNVRCGRSVIRGLGRRRNNATGVFLVKQLARQMPCRSTR